MSTVKILQPRKTEVVRLMYHDVEVTVSPTSDTNLFRSPRNPPFLQERVLRGIDLYVRKTKQFHFFYAIRWDLTKEPGISYHILTREQAEKVIKSLVSDDYFGQALNKEVRKKLSRYKLIQLSGSSLC